MYFYTVILLFITESDNVFCLFLSNESRRRGIAELLRYILCFIYILNFILTELYFTEKYQRPQVTRRDYFLFRASGRRDSRVPQRRKIAERLILYFISNFIFFSFIFCANEHRNAERAKRRKGIGIPRIFISIRHYYPFTFIHTFSFISITIQRNISLALVEQRDLFCQTTFYMARVNRIAVISIREPRTHRPNFIFVLFIFKIIFYLPKREK